MPIRAIFLNRSKPYHVVSRAAQGSILFQDGEDRNRFVFQMYAANLGKPALNVYRTDMGHLGSALLHGYEVPERSVVREHAPLVDIFSFVLAGDHYHLGLVARKEEGISQYMRKLNIGFAKYYNLKRARRGALFEARFRAFPVRTSSHLDSLIRYLNVKKLLDLHEPSWETESFDLPQALEFMHNYPYSSFPDLFQGRGSHLIEQATLQKLEQVLGEAYLQHSQPYLQTLHRLQERRACVWPEAVGE